MRLNSFSLLLCLHVSFSEDRVFIQLPEGTVRGGLEKSDSGLKFYSFYGIPYALPPTGKRRFKKPEPVETWSSVKGGDIVECAQEDTGREDLFSWGEKLRGVEDCLVVNIYTPDMIHGDYPVMVFIHGGGYFAGKVHMVSEYCPSTLI